MLLHGARLLDRRHLLAAVRLDVVDGDVAIRVLKPAPDVVEFDAPVLQRVPLHAELLAGGGVEPDEAGLDVDLAGGLVEDFEHLLAFPELLVGRLHDDGVGGGKRHGEAAGVAHRGQEELLHVVRLEVLEFERLREAGDDGALLGDDVDAGAALLLHELQTVGREDRDQPLFPWLVLQAQAHELRRGVRPARDDRGARSLAERADDVRERRLVEFHRNQDFAVLVNGGCRLGLDRHRGGRGRCRGDLGRCFRLCRGGLGRCRRFDDNGDRRFGDNLLCDLLHDLLHDLRLRRGFDGGGDGGARGRGRFDRRGRAVENRVDRCVDVVDSALRGGNGLIQQRGHQQRGGENERNSLHHGIVPCLCFVEH